MRDRLRAGGSLVFCLLVAAQGAFAWREAGDRALAAAEAEGRALLGAVAAGAESSLAASRAVQGLLAERLTAEAHAVAARVSENPGLEEVTLAREVERRGLSGAVLLDPALDVVASADAARGAPGTETGGPFAAERLARLDTAALVARLRAAPPTDGGAVVVGFEEGPFSGRTEFSVAVAAPSLPGHVVLRADASRLEEFRRGAGISRVLRDSALAPGIAFLALQSADGAVLASGDPGLVGAVLPAAPSSPTWQTGPDGRRTLDLAVPVAWEGGPRGHLRVALDAAPVEDVVRRSRGTVAAMTAAAVAAGLAGFLALSAVERRRRDSETRFREALAERERFASLGRMAAGFAHEVRGPLNALSMSTQLLAREADGAARRDRLAALAADVRAAVGRADAVVGDFLELGRAGAPVAAAPLDLADVVSDAVADAVAGVAGAAAPEVATTAPGAPVRVAGDRRLLARAVANLVRNALQAAPPGTVRVTWGRHGGEAVLDVDDGGPGVPAEERARIFDAFRTSRRDGTGLGLAIARDVVVRHGGRIDVETSPAGGARFRVRLPAEASS